MSTFERMKLSGEKVAKAFVVFVGQADFVWLRWLKPGFRHCFVLLNDGERWISIDPLLNHMDVQVHSVPSDFDMWACLEGCGHKVVEAKICRSHERPAPLMVFTCVEAVKRVLGLHDWRVMTPWQLYRRLIEPGARP